MLVIQLHTQVHSASFGVAELPHQDSSNWLYLSRQASDSSSTELKKRPWYVENGSSMPNFGPELDMISMDDGLGQYMWAMQDFCVDSSYEVPCMVLDN